MTVLFVSLLFGMPTAKSATATDFFPLTPGIRRTYSDSAKPAPYSDMVEPPVEIDKQSATPLANFEGGVRSTATYYRASDTQVDLVAFDVKRPFKEPQPFFKVGTGKVDWTYQGTTQAFNASAPLVIKGESHPGGKEKVLGQTVDTLVVVLDAVVGRDKLDSYSSHQEIVLGKGIGMIEKKETVTFGSRKNSHVVKLIGFERGRA